MAKYTDLELFAEFKQKVNFLITHKGYTQATIAEKVGENRGNFNRYLKNETIKPTKKTLQKYLTKLNTVFSDDLKKMDKIKNSTSNQTNVSVVQENEQTYSSIEKKLEKTFLTLQKSIESLSLRQEAMEKTILQFMNKHKQEDSLSVPVFKKSAKKRK